MFLTVATKGAAGSVAQPLTASRFAALRVRDAGLDPARRCTGRGSGPVKDEGNTEREAALAVTWTNTMGTVGLAASRNP